jgi:hypothetical protein
MIAVPRRREVAQATDRRDTLGTTGSAMPAVPIPE